MSWKNAVIYFAHSCRSTVYVGLAQARPNYGICKIHYCFAFCYKKYVVAIGPAAGRPFPAPAVPYMATVYLYVDTCVWAIGYSIAIVSTWRPGRSGDARLGLGLGLGLG